MTNLPQIDTGFMLKFLTELLNTPSPTGFTQAAMWKQFNPDGTLLYGNFLETVTQIMPMYMMRAFGGTLYLAGYLLLAYNVIKTAQAGSAVEDELAEAAPLKKITPSRLAGEGFHSWLERRTILFSFLVVHFNNCTRFFIVRHFVLFILFCYKLLFPKVSF